MNGKELVLPLAMVVALIGNAVFFGVTWGRSSQRLDTFEVTLGEIKDSIGAMTRRYEVLSDKTSDITLDVREMKRNQATLEKELYLLRDYTEGRVAHLPYRKAR